ncbi:MAG: glycosyltransferase [Smithella sp.]|jgi:glycosyltransferase involved in cell wall biosynthesis
MTKVCISALVVVFNEEKYLDACLKQLLFCDELVVVDLGSRDQSLQIASRYATQIIKLPFIDLVEAVHCRMIPQLKNNLILIIDPDEILPDGLVAEIKDFIDAKHDFDQINAPWRFIFKNKILRGTVWGGNDKWKKIILNKNSLQLLPHVHRGIKYNKEKASIINLKSRHFIQHYWCDSYRQLFDKHLRYIKKEGESRYGEGARYSFSKKVKESLMALYAGLINMKGILYGPREIFLSFFYAWYVWQANNSLKHYEKRFE